MAAHFTQTARDLANYLDAEVMHRIADWCDYCTNGALGLESLEEQRFAALRDAIVGVVEMQPDARTVTRGQDLSPRSA